jgi:hypothetical protein
MKTKPTPKPDITKEQLMGMYPTPPHEDIYCPKCKTFNERHTVMTKPEFMETPRSPFQLEGRNRLYQM